MRKPKKGTAYLTTYDLRPRGRTVRTLDLKSIELDDDREFDPSTMAMLYGAAGTLREMSRVHAQAIRTQQDLYQISVGIEVENIIVEFLTPEDLSKTKMMNLSRTSKELQKVIQTHWRGYLKKEGMKDDAIESNVEWRSMRYISDRPDLLAKLAKEPEFKHLNLIIAPIVSNNEVLKIGFVLNKDAIRDVYCKTHSNIPVALDGKVISESEDAAEAAT